jgi:hypothetical protein
MANQKEIGATLIEDHIDSVINSAAAEPEVISLLIFGIKTLTGIFKFRTFLVLVFKEYIE